MEIKKIFWFNQEPPASFPCHVCLKRKAYYIGKFKREFIEMNLVLCAQCIMLTDPEIFDKMGVDYEINPTD